MGTIRFTSQFAIKHVLYVPQFSLNLIYVSKLCLELSCIVIFINSKCLLQDPQSLKMIGSNDFIEGPYYLNLQNEKIPSRPGISVSHTITIPDKALWNFRLGHLSISRMNLLQSYFPFIVVGNRNN